MVSTGSSLKGTERSLDNTEKFLENIIKPLEDTGKKNVYITLEYH